MRRAYLHYSNMDGCARHDSPAWGGRLNFDLSEEQRLLRDLIDRYAERSLRRGQATALCGGCSAAFLPKAGSLMAETGLLAFPFAEELGGLGGDSDTMITVMEAAGPQRDDGARAAGDRAGGRRARACRLGRAEGGLAAAAD